MTFKKKVAYVSLALVAALVFLLPIRKASARVNGANVSGYDYDIWCVGRPVGNEVCVDKNGSFVPTALVNTQTIGTSAAPFSTVYTNNLSVGCSTCSSTLGGNVTLTAVVGTQNVPGTGNLTFPTYGNLGSGIANTECAPYNTLTTVGGGLYASSTVVVGCSFEVLTTTGTLGNMLMTATPTISTTTVFRGANAIPSGFQLVLTSTLTIGVILQDQGTLSGSQLALGAATRTVTKTKTLTLIWEPLLARWAEIAYGNNQGN